MTKESEEIKDAYRRLGEWGDAMTKAPDPVGRRTRRAEDGDYPVKLSRAGFEPRRGCDNVEWYFGTLLWSQRFR